MINAVRRFEAQFQPYGDDYVAWPGGRYGGKFVTAKAHDEMRVAVIRHVGEGWKNWPVLFGMLATVAWAIAKPIAGGPWWLWSVGNGIIFTAVMAYDHFWVSGPMWRLRNEPDLLPPRSYNTAIRAQSTGISWLLLAFLAIIAVVGIWYAIIRSLATPLAVGALLLFGTNLLAVLYLAIAKWRGPPASL